MPECRRLEYTVMDDAELKAALFADWRAYWEAMPDSKEQMAVFNALMDAKWVCQDRGCEGWWHEALVAARARVQGERGR